MSEGSAGVPLVDIVRGNRPHREAILEALANVVDSGRFLFGPDVSELESGVASLSQAEHAIGCASGSDALLLSLMALNIGPGDEVIVPSFTFFASVSCITRVGAIPKFVDIDPTTFNIDPESVAAAITPATKAVIAVHLFGQCAAIDRLCQIGNQHGIPVIEDAAQAIGAAWCSRPAGSWGKVGCFSFYPTKNLGGMGDGGMLTTSDYAMADRLRLLAGHGMRPRYYHQEVGINSRLDSFQAAVLRVKIEHLSESIRRRQAIANRYTEQLQDAGLVDSGELILPTLQADAYHVWNQYAIRATKGQRASLREYLKKRGIQTEIFYPIPVHRQKCYEKFAWANVDLPHSDQVSQEVINLPIFSGLTDNEQARVIEGVCGYFLRQGQVAA